MRLRRPAEVDARGPVLAGRGGLRRRGRRHVAGVVVVLCAELLGTGLGTAAAAAEFTEFVAEARVLIAPAPGNAFAEQTPNSLEDLVTDAQLARSDAVLAAAVNGDGAAVDQLRRRTSVRLVPDTQIVVLSVRAAEAEAAESTVLVLADAFVQARGQRAQLAVENRRAVLVPRVQAAQDELSAAVDVGRVDDVAVTILSRRLAVLRGELRDLVDADANTGSLLRVTSVEAPALRLTTVIGAIAGGVAGFGLGLALAWCLAVRRRRAATTAGGRPTTSAGDGARRPERPRVASGVQRAGGGSR